MTKVRYKDGRLYISNFDPWGEFKSIEFNPRDLDYKYKSELIRAVDEMNERQGSNDEKRDPEAARLMKTIRMLDFIGRYPILASFVDTLFDHIEDSGCDRVVVDFDGVGFIGELFAKRFVERMDDCDVEINVSEVSWEIKKMFEMIKNQ